MQARALALREASKEIHGGEPNAPWIAARLQKEGGGEPGRSALFQFYEKVDNDPDWFPGKHTEKRRGPKPLLTAAKRQRIATSAMGTKERGDEPSVPEVVQRCPVATLNPRTKRPFTAKYILKVFVEDCYDFDPDHPWKYQNALQKVFLPDDVKTHRWDMARCLQRMDLTGTWWFNNVVWMDPCTSILPGTRVQYEKMKQALKGKRRLISDNAKMYSRNLQGPPTANKQASWGTTKIHWIMILARGVAWVEIMPETWSMDADGMAAVVEGLPGILRRMLGPAARLPRTLFTDRGPGMYAPNGVVLGGYSNALQQQGFRLFWGPDAKQQSPDMGDVLLHETAVSWFRRRLHKAKPEVLPWLESREQWAARAKRVMRAVNAECEVRNLCLEMPERIQSLISLKGDRLKK